MTIENDAYEFLIEPIREEDERNGALFLKRYFEGFQEVWRRTDNNIQSIPDLWSIDDCPDEYLKYLKNIVGWTSQLEYITDLLDFDRLRSLLSISGDLWKLRGTEDIILDVMFYTTGMRCYYWNWFDFRWVLGYVETPNSVIAGASNVTAVVDSLVGDRPDKDGLLIRITCLLPQDDFTSSVYEEVPVYWNSSSKHNEIITTGNLGQTSPSSNENDYEIVMVSAFGNEINEERRAYDSWVVDLPEPDEAGAEYESNLRIVDDGTLNRDLVIALLQLMRATGERWEITYLKFLDRFTIDGDYFQWQFDTGAGIETYAVSDGILNYTTDSLTVFPLVVPFSLSSVGEEASYYSRTKIYSISSNDGIFVLHFNYQDSDNYYLAQFRIYDDNNGRSSLSIRRVVSGSPTVIAGVDLTNIAPLYFETWYGFRVSIVNEDSDKRIVVCIDTAEVLNYLDTSPLSGAGTIALGGGYAIDVDEVEVLGLPAENDYVDIG